MTPKRAGLTPKKRGISPTVDSTIFPTSEARKTTGSNFALAIVILPSFLAVLVPVFPNSPSNNDIAVLITDALIVLLVTWVVRVMSEWPWDWFIQIEESKAKILNMANSKLLISGMSRDIQSKLKIVQSLVRKQNTVLFYCVCATVGGAMIMVLTRNYIIVEDSRRAIVFSNLNVGIYVVWGMYRMMSVVFEAAKARSLDEVLGTEYNLITEANIGLYVEKEEYDYVEKAVGFFCGLLGIERTEPLLALKLEETEQKLQAMQKAHTEHIGELQKSILSLQADMDSHRESGLPNSFVPYPLNMRKGQTVFRRDSLDIFAQSTLNQSTGERLSAIFDTKSDTEEPEASISSFGGVIFQVFSMFTSISTKYPFSYICKNPLVLIDIYNEDIKPELGTWILNKSLHEPVKQAIKSWFYAYVVADMVLIQNYIRSLGHKAVGLSVQIARFLVQILFIMPCKQLLRLVLFFPRRLWKWILRTAFPAQKPEIHSSHTSNTNRFQVHNVDIAPRRRKAH